MDFDHREHAELLRECDWVHRLARALVVDPGAAADAAQDTLLLALRRPPRPGAPVRPWLAGLLGNLLRQNRRGAARRAVREAQHAEEQRAHEEDPAARLARLELHRRVIGLVLALDEPYRSTLVQRYLDDRSPTEIAHHTGVPVKTVYTRIERALAQLRAKLDRGTSTRASDRRHEWAVLLNPGVASVSAPTKVAAGSGFWSPWILMSTTQRSLLAVAFLLVMGFGLRAAFHGAAHEPSHVLQPHAEVALATLPAPDAAVVPAERPRAHIEQGVPFSDVPAAPSADPATTAIVDVFVRSEETGAALAGFGVRAFPRTLANPFLFSDARLTDATGRARFEVRAPVNCGFYGLTGASKSVDLVPGVTRSVELLVKNVRVVQVTVVGSDGLPVADAGVWLSDSGNYTNGLIVGRTSDEGRFAVSVGESNYLGARKSGQLASHLINVQKDVHDVRIALRGPSGRLHGVVRDTLDAPVSGAIIQLGVERNSLPSGPDGKSITGAPGARIRSDAKGRFRFDECEPGRHPLLVRAEGFAMDQRMVDMRFPTDGVLPEDPLAALPALDIVLSQAVTIEGWVTYGGGQPLAAATVAYGPYGSLESGLAKSDASGRFTLDSAPVGPLELRANLRDVGQARTTVDGRPGETLTWSPVLSLGPILAGTVVDEGGAPRVGFVVQAYTVAAREQRPPTAVTDEAGRFRLTYVLPAPYDLHVSPREFSQSIHVEEEVQPDGLPRTIVVPEAALATATVTGTLTGHDGGALPPELQVFAFTLSDLSRAWPLRFEGTGFAGGPWVPGQYELRTSSHTYPQTCLNRFTLAPGEQRDLGSLRLEQLATLALEAVTVGGAAMLEFDRVSIHIRGLGALEGSWRMTSLDEHNHGSLELAPGSYALLASDRRSSACMTTVTLAPGEVHQKRLELLPATHLEVLVSGGREAGLDPVEYEVRDDHSALILRAQPSPRLPLLPPGLPLARDPRTSTRRRAHRDVPTRSRLRADRAGPLKSGLQDLAQVRRNRLTRRIRPLRRQWRTSRELVRAGLSPSGEWGRSRRYCRAARAPLLFLRLDDHRALRARIDSSRTPTAKSAGGRRAFGNGVRTALHSAATLERISPNTRGPPSRAVASPVGLRQGPLRET